MSHDWNGDGKNDWRDDAFYHTVLNSDTKSDETKTPSKDGKKATKPQQQKPWQSFKRKPSQLGSAVAVVAIILILIALFSGYTSVIPTLLVVGTAAFCIANLLDR